MNCGFNMGGCGCQSCMPTFYTQPMTMGTCQTWGLGGGNNWFAIILIIFLLLVICGCTKIC